MYEYFRKNGGPEKIQALDSVDWDVSLTLALHEIDRLTYAYQAWLYGEGIELPVKMEYDISLAEQAYKLAERWDASRNISDVSQLDFKGKDLDGFNSNQIGIHPSFECPQNP